MNPDELNPDLAESAPILDGVPRTDSADAPPLRRWQDGVAPAFISFFLSILFFDQLAPSTLAEGGFWASMAGAAVGGGLAFALLYYAPAMWCFRTRRDLLGVAALTFGTAGSRWIPGFVIGITQVVVFAVAIAYAAKLNLEALVMGGVLDPASLDVPDPSSTPGFGGPVFLSTITVWMLTAAFLGPILVKIVSAILYAYAVVPALVLGGLMAWFLSGLGRGSLPLETSLGWWNAFGAMVQLVFAYAATGGMIAADWGAASRGAHDVRLGGIVGLGLAPWIIASVSLITVAGATGKFAGTTQDSVRVRVSSTDPASVESVLPGDYQYSRAVLRDGIGGVPGCVLTMTFCLALLGPACFAPSVFQQRLSAVVPQVPAWGLSLACATLAWPLAASGASLRITMIFGVLGAVTAPIAGTIAADFARGRGRLSKPRPGFSSVSVFAWGAGMSIGLIPYIGPLLGATGLARLQPAAVLAFAMGFLVRFVLGRAPDQPLPASP